MSDQRKDRYLFLTTYVRSLETHMLTRERLERALAVPDFEELSKLLAECGYEDMSEMSLPEIDRALSRHRAEIFRSMARLTPERELVDAFRIKYDYHNAKVLIKAEGAGTPAEHLLSDSGRVPVKLLSDAFREDNFVRVPMELSLAVEEARRIMGQTRDPQLVDLTLDKAYFAELGAFAAKLGSRFLAEYVRDLTDCANLRTAVRVGRMGRDADYLRGVLIDGGTIGYECFPLADVTPEVITAAFSATAFRAAAALGAEALRGGTLTRFEMACDNTLTARLRRAKTMGYGDDPVIAYLAAVEAELTTVRMLVTGRRTGMDRALIRERLRDLYV